MSYYLNKSKTLKTCFFYETSNLEDCSSLQYVIVITAAAEPYDKHNVTHDCNLSLEQFP